MQVIAEIALVNSWNLFSNIHLTTYVTPSILEKITIVKQIVNLHKKKCFMDTFLENSEYNYN